MKIFKHVIKIYKEEEAYPTFTIESDTEIDSSIYLNEWDCKEEIYLDEELIDTIYHTI
jgi:hypothetical protein